MGKLEKFCIVEREPIEFISRIANGDAEVWHSMKGFMKRTGMVKDEMTVDAYECLHGLMCF